MKTLNVPFIADLEKMSPEAFDEAMARDASFASLDSVNWPAEFPYKPSVAIRIARSREYVALRWEVEENAIRATSLADNGNSWEDSCVEFFCGTSQWYVNVETTCIGSVLVKKGVDRSNRSDAPLEEVATVIRRSSLPFEAVEKVDGPYRWTLVTIIPMTVLGLNPDALPESVGANFYKCGDKTAVPHFVSWSPIDTPSPDFHRPEFFGTVTFK